MPKKIPDDQCMRGFKRDIDCHSSPIEILPLGDLHIGDPSANMTLIKQLINSVKDNPNRYTVLVGDLMNTAIAGGKSDSYSEVMKPSEQLETCYDLFSPIADKILAIVPGNHEERITRSVGVDMTRLMARELDLDDIYSDNSALVFLKFGQQPDHKDRPLVYSMYVNHGHGGGGRKVGSKLNSLQDFASLIDADVYVVGHTHLPATFKQSAYRINPNYGIATLHEQVFVNTASSLSYGGYGNRGGYQPPSNSYPVITLDDKKQHVSVTI